MWHQQFNSMTDLTRDSKSRLRCSMSYDLQYHPPSNVTHTSKHKTYIVRSIHTAKKNAIGDTLVASYKRIRCPPRPQSHALPRTTACRSTTATQSPAVSRTSDAAVLPLHSTVCFAGAATPSVQCLRDECLTDGAGLLISTLTYVTGWYVWHGTCRRQEFPASLPSLRSQLYM